MSQGAMIPDWGFRKELKRMDSKLDVKWNSGFQRWTIVRETAAPGNLYNYEAGVMRVANDDGSYRPLDSRTLRSLRRYDGHTRGADTVANDIIEEQINHHAAIKKDEDRDMADLVSEELLPRAKKDAENLNALNIPKEDVEKMMQPRLGRE